MARLPGKRTAKLDSHAAVGIFLGYTATEKNIYYQDVNTLHIKTATHITFDEANFTVLPTMLSPAMATLQRLGYHQQQGQTQINLNPQNNTEINLDQPQATHDTVIKMYQIHLLSVNGHIPTKAPDGSVGYDVYSGQDIAYILTQDSRSIQIYPLHHPQAHMLR